MSAQSSAPAPAPIDVCDHVGLAHKVVRRYGWARQGVDYDDAIQVALVAMLRARETYRPQLGAWSTWATWWIRARCGRYADNHSSTVRVPVARQQSRRKAGEAPRATVMSLNAPVYGGRDGGRDGGVCGEHQDRIQYEPGEGLAPANDRDDLPDVTLEDLIARTPSLSERQRGVLRRRAQGATLEEVGASLGVSRERARQIECDATLRIREMLVRDGELDTVEVPRVIEHRRSTQAAASRRQRRRKKAA